MTLISLLDSSVAWFKASHGVHATETPRAISFCAHAILGEETFVVPDTLEDPRFRDGPLVTGEPYIRFYAGHPLRVADGSKVGTLCVMDRVTRGLTGQQALALQRLSRQVLTQLEVRRHVAKRSFGCQHGTRDSTRQADAAKAPRMSGLFLRRGHGGGHGDRQ